MSQRLGSMSSRLFCVQLLMAVLLMALVAVEAASPVGAQSLLKSGDRLRLSQKQKAEIKSIVGQTVVAYNRIGREKNGPDAKRKQLALRNSALKNAVALLTREQQSVWAKISRGETQPSPNGLLNADLINSRSLIVPTISQMKNPPSRGAYGPNAEIVRTRFHSAIGDGYVIVTDHDDPIALGALKRLADFRKGDVISVKSLGNLYKTPDEFRLLQTKLKKLVPRYVAIAPKVESYRENMHLCMLRLLSSLDEDPSLDVFPGYLMAGSLSALEDLITRTIAYSPMARSEIKPVSIGAIEDADVRRYRSYQKAKVMQKAFAAEGVESPAIIVTTRNSHLKRNDFPQLKKSEGNISMNPRSERYTFDALSPDAVEALNSNNVLFMFGHGTTGRICGAKTSAYKAIDFTNELVFCGSCMSASPYEADRIDLNDKRQDTRFAFQAVENGAVMMLGHMGLCGGFPKVYPMSEHVLEGLSTGESYQRLMNALIGDNEIPDYYPVPAPERAVAKDAANGLLYILWGDPALVAFKKD